MIFGIWGSTPKKRGLLAKDGVGFPCHMSYEEWDQLTFASFFTNLAFF